MLLKAFRFGAGYLIVFLNWVTRPKAALRPAEEQSKVESAMEGHSLYQLTACPFCVKTRRALRRLNVDVDIRDIAKDQQYRQQLESGGGRVKVPCLRIQNGEKVDWMYESGDIIKYLEQRVAAAV